MCRIDEICGKSKVYDEHFVLLDGNEWKGRKGRKGGVVENKFADVFEFESAAAIAAWL